MSERDQFESWFEEHTGWDAEDYPNKYLLNVCYEAWQASREALKAEQGEDSELLSSAKKLEQEAGDIADRLKQSSDIGFMLVPVADLYVLETLDGSAYAYTECADKAGYWLKSGFGVREYVLLHRLQDAMNHPIDTTPNQYDALGKGER